MDATPRPCQTRPADWWEFGDDGNRLAILLCAACPGCLFPKDCQPYGMVVAGRAYDDDGDAHALCECGYPAQSKPTRHRNKRQLCSRCTPPDINPWREHIMRRHARGHKVADIARYLPFSYDHVRKSLATWLSDATQPA